MSEPTFSQRTYMKAAEIANTLLGEGVPVIGFSDMDGGHRIGIAFQLTDERAKYATRLPVEEASAERFRALYEAVR